NSTTSGITLKEKHPGFVLSGWVKVGSDSEFDNYIKTAEQNAKNKGIDVESDLSKYYDKVHTPDVAHAVHISCTSEVCANRAEIAFEQYDLDGSPLGSETKFTVGLDLLGNVYSYQSGVVPFLVNNKATNFEITDTDFYETSSTPRVHPKFKNFSIKPGETVLASGARARNLNRWKRIFIHFYPPVGEPKGLVKGKRYVLYMYPKQGSYSGLSVYFDGIQLQRSKYATRYTHDKTLILGPLSETGPDGKLMDVVKPLNELLPYQMR
ncbi:MAG TPA: hypothetical protein PK467_09680, partial [Candidatus Wallbacteria bacterium]|nr:hypothetical protein [Candidatus Wallbacteria bacterium]